MYDAVYARKLVHQPTPEAVKRIEQYATQVVAEFAALAADQQRTGGGEAISKYCLHSDEEVRPCYHNCGFSLLCIVSQRLTPSADVQVRSPYVLPTLLGANMTSARDLASNARNWVSVVSIAKHYFLIDLVVDISDPIICSSCECTGVVSL
jgi:hypothetical protein